MQCRQPYSSQHKASTTNQRTKTMLKLWKWVSSWSGTVLIMENSAPAAGKKIIIPYTAFKKEEFRIQLRISTKQTTSSGCGTLRTIYLLTFQLRTVLNVLWLNQYNLVVNGFVKYEWKRFSYSIGTQTFWLKPNCIDTTWSRDPIVVKGLLWYILRWKVRLF